MQQGDWKSLGQALKQLRVNRDLGQKEVISRSKVAMGNRTLYGYESGEQRPPRDRLLKLVIRSFELKDVTEINRYLQLAGYATLSDGEILEYGLNPLEGKISGGRSPEVPRPPVDFRIEASTLIVRDGQGREIWRHQFPSRLNPSAYDPQIAMKRCAFADLDDDGAVETLFAYVPFDFTSVGTTLICFAADGSIRWEFVPGKTVSDSMRREYCPPYFISNVQAIRIPGSGSRVIVSSNHYIHNPNQVAMLNTDGQLVSEYWHSGHLLSVVHADLNGDGIEEMLLAGVNNGYHQATLVIFDPRNVSGASAQPGRQILGLSAGTEKAVVLFPKTCVAKTALYNRAIDLRITQERRITVVVAEGVAELQNPGLMIYELDYGLNVISARPDSRLQENHHLLEAQGLLDHSWAEDENERLRGQVVVNGRL